jgi:hypothetical protein
MHNVWIRKFKLETFEKKKIPHILRQNKIKIVFYGFDLALLAAL